MRNRMKTILGFFAVYLVSCFLIASLSFGQEMPKPGTVIDKSNYKTYAHLLPAEVLPLFEDSYGLVNSGLLKPISIKVGEAVVRHIPKAFLANSAVNKGKYSLDAEGNIVGGWQRQGLPFPDLQMSDKDFTIKLMWNYATRFRTDDWRIHTYSYMQRKGEAVRWNAVDLLDLYLVNRTVVPPIPVMESYDNAAYLGLLFYKEPASVKNMMMVSIRYRDPRKVDDVFIYLPNLRRVLRGDTGQRAVPLQGNIASLDDLDIFDGRTPEFTFKLIGEQKTLVARDWKQVYMYRNPVSPLPFLTEFYSIADCWILDIFAKDPMYPVSKKRIYLDKETLQIYYGFNWDRAGKPWKMWVTGFTEYPIPGEPPAQVLIGSWGVDLQFGMVNGMYFYDPNHRGCNTGSYRREDFTPSAMLKLGQ